MLRRRLRCVARHLSPAAVDEDLVARFHEDGYLLLPNFLDPDHVSQIVQIVRDMDTRRMHAACRGAAQSQQA